MTPQLLPYGTKVRITDPKYMYNIDIPTPDNEDIEHTHAAPDGFVIVRDE